MPEIRGLLFDKDGTLSDFQATWGRWTVAFLRDISGGDATKAARMADALQIDLATEVFAPTSPVIAGTAEEVLNLLLPHLPDVDPDAFYSVLTRSSAEAPQVEATPLQPLVRDLRHAGLRLGVATNDAEIGAVAFLDAAGVRDAFDFVAGFDSGHGAKPGPGMCLAFCAATGLSPGEVAMVGDSTHDLAAATAAGMRRVAVLTGVATRSELAPHADVVLPDISHLPDWLAVN